jgi:hypothetical protein
MSITPEFAAVAFTMLMVCFIPLASFVEKQDLRKLFEKLGYTALDVGLASKLFHSNLTVDL